ncbi:hypothetical protein Pmani_023754 [Petrolisthes manimaculis]|uniref:Uncharacterized protein n=1 Tax=Petrolisthes manimaculis TaxID=1843537 RepID=A0AAE1U0S9_9EUCA|nr:hypothetical protein Pmani_023754 [Petrolisthes manimaculis]
MYCNFPLSSICIRRSDENYRSSYCNSPLSSAGIRGTYQEVTATILKQGSNQAMRFYVMETCKDMYRGGDPTKPVPKLIVD